MRHRSRPSLAEDLLDIVARLPWWVGVALAVVSGAVLHHAASQPLVVGTTAAPSATLILSTAWRGLATALQFIVPLICLAGAGISAWRRSHRRRLVAGVAAPDDGTAADVLHGMSWREFEVLVAEAFRLQGWRVAETGGGGPDGGVDLVLTRGGETFLVQCKQGRALKVGVDVVRELYGVMAARGATGGFVMTAGRFTDDAKAFAEGRQVRLIDGPQLRRLIRDARHTAATQRPAGPVQSSTSPASPVSSAAAIPAGTDQPALPASPQYGRAMVRRTARRGPSAGESFWGCSGYPACRGTRPAS